MRRCLRLLLCLSLLATAACAADAVAGPAPAPEPEALSPAAAEAQLVDEAADAPESAPHGVLMRCPAFISERPVEPLYVVDGVIGRGPRGIGSDDLVSVQVLKPADAASLYGTRAALGAVIVPTRRGASSGAAAQPVAGGDARQ